ncbi:c-type cytochrome [Thermoflavimicrobium daqui]|jgi:mono/diheme cytochrome c family protein|uniref:Cytochrome C551 n=1 Tax=Thermoflavimicrobium daqui TaxID=2137476 RepID=A0A364K590_9BACL|nr:cytochrome c [Thermoflavimicrobium daqui]RAL24535.1 cytochrome C551 [Thermoflavimicrobium daqui]
MLKSKKLFLIVAMSTVLLAACGSNQSAKTDQPGQAQEASLAPEEIYANNCSSCHGGNLEGRIGPNLEKIGGKMSKDQISKIIKDGKGSMPSQMQLSDQAREKLSNWLAEKK